MNYSYTHEYLTVEEYYRRNGKRHLERAIAYTSASYPDRYYEGSMKKALRNLKKADELKVPDLLKPILNKLSDQVADAIMYGTLFTKNNGSTIEYIGLQNIFVEK